MRLFHVSEQPEITRFDPRPATASDARVAGAVVWAIGETHLPNYLVPRDCPRVTYVCGPQTSVSDRERYFGASPARRIIAIEPRWLERAMHTPIHVYELPAATFECIDDCAGHFISRQPVVPLDVRRIDKPLSAMLEHDVELRLVKDLLALQDEVVRSTLVFSSTRLRNISRQR